MKGQVAEYVLVFAAVVAVAIIVLALSFTEFPYAVFDTQAVILGQGAGYGEVLNGFRDGAVSIYSAEYNVAANQVKILLSVLGWNDAPIKQAIATAMAKYGYVVVWK